LAKVRDQLEILEKDIQTQQLDQQEQQTQREIAEVKLHEEDIKYHKVRGDIDNIDIEHVSFSQLIIVSDLHYLLIIMCAIRL